MLDFYDVDLDYINFLKQYDTQIPNISYTSHNKFVCGIVLNVNGIKYYAPISSNTVPQRTNFLIYDNKRPISSIKFCFMFPAKEDVIQKKDISAIRTTDPAYADLLQMEYSYCVSHEQNILQKAEQVYQIGTNPSHKLFYTCCDFKKLEEIYESFH